MYISSVVPKHQPIHFPFRVIYYSLGNLKMSRVIKRKKVVYLVSVSPTRTLCFTQLQFHKDIRIVSL